MSERVMWAVKVAHAPMWQTDGDGERELFASRPLALKEASEWPEQSKARLVKVTFRRKPKPVQKSLWEVAFDKATEMGLEIGTRRKDWATVAGWRAVADAVAAEALRRAAVKP